MNNQKQRGLRLYIGSSLGRGYYINTKGESYINSHTPTFENIDSLLKHIKERYKKRKARLIAISNEIGYSDQKRILNVIKGNNLKIKISNSLEDKFN